MSRPIQFFGTALQEEMIVCFRCRVVDGNRPLAQLLSAHAIGAEGLGFESQAGQIGTASPTARHRCDVSSELCSPGAKVRRWAPPLVTRFYAILRVLYNEDLIFEWLIV